MEPARPDGTSSPRPKFDATNPAAYPAGAWYRYDLIDLGAPDRDRWGRQIGIALYCQSTAPAPNWATSPVPNHEGFRFTSNINGPLYGQFVQAVGKRYHGHYPALNLDGGVARDLPPHGRRRLDRAGPHRPPTRHDSGRRDGGLRDGHKGSGRTWTHWCSSARSTASAPATPRCTPPRPVYVTECGCRTAGPVRMSPSHRPSRPSSSTRASTWPGASRIHAFAQLLLTDAARTRPIRRHPSPTGRPSRAGCCFTRPATRSPPTSPSSSRSGCPGPARSPRGRVGADPSRPPHRHAAVRAPGLGHVDRRGALRPEQLRGLVSTSMNLPGVIRRAGSGDRPISARPAPAQPKAPGLIAPVRTRLSSSRRATGSVVMS